MCPWTDSGAKAAPNRYKVLVVDDEPTLRLGFSYALGDHETDTAGGGREALVKIENGDYDMMVLDLRMPDIDGLQVIETLRRRGNFMPVVLCSAALTPAATLRAITGQVVDFLLKPVSPAELRGIVDHVMNSGEDRLARALKDARSGQWDEAIRHLEQVPEESPRVASWLNTLRAIRFGGLAGEASAFAKLERNGLEQLAFRLPA